ncbi:NUDIX hydrolase [Clostridium sp. D2Q-11]|uniref:NUDIX hydrolase n=1 Tax=Anaeromonas frigoriresistens TaxID=2683708 RepID=A0A942Z8C0_9FIRM|nr:NUDIX hydrolase [Anaeromonas frigoriresistens]MBS4539632.1 NUDIX hydrolase [Anaeromonas frigoriresistens]
MLLRICAGGVVFHKDMVFILKNEKDEWVLPKGKIRTGDLAIETAVNRVREETGLSFKIVSTAGETSYEFYSLSRQKPVCNEIIWFIMEANSLDYNINKDEFKDGGFYSIEDAVEKITYSQDKSLVHLSYKKYLKFKEEDLAVV